MKKILLMTGFLISLSPYSQATTSPATEEAAGAGSAASPTRRLATAGEMDLSLWAHLGDDIKNKFTSLEDFIYYAGTYKGGDAGQWAAAAVTKKTGFTTAADAGDEVYGAGVSSVSPKKRRAIPFFGEAKSLEARLFNMRQAVEELWRFTNKTLPRLEQALARFSDESIVPLQEDCAGKTRELTTLRARYDAAQAALGALRASPLFKFKVPTEHATLEAYVGFLNRVDASGLNPKLTAQKAELNAALGELALGGKSFADYVTEVTNAPAVLAQEIKIGETGLRTATNQLDPVQKEGAAKQAEIGKARGNVDVLTARITELLTGPKNIIAKLGKHGFSLDLSSLGEVSPFAAGSTVERGAQADYAWRLLKLYVDGYSKANLKAVKTFGNPPKKN